MADEFKTNNTSGEFKTNNTPSKGKVYKQKFRDAWLSKEFNPWLERSYQDPDRPYCLFCEKQLEGGIVHLRRHAKSIIHKKKEELYHHKINKIVPEVEAEPSNVRVADECVHAMETDQQHAEAEHHQELRQQQSTHVEHAHYLPALQIKTQVEASPQMTPQHHTIDNGISAHIKYSKMENVAAEPTHLMVSSPYVVSSGAVQTVYSDAHHYTTHSGSVHGISHQAVAAAAQPGMIVATQTTDGNYFEPAVVHQNKSSNSEFIVQDPLAPVSIFVHVQWLFNLHYIDCVDNMTSRG